MAADSANQAIACLLLRYFEDHNLFDSARALERETGIIFNMKHFVNMIRSDRLDEAEHYLNGFTKFDDNVVSARVYFLLRHLKFLEALKCGTRWQALDIAVNELRCFNRLNSRIYDRACALLAMDDPSHHPMVRDFNKEAAIIYVARESKWCIMNNPIFTGKLKFPPLWTIMQQVFANGNPPPYPDGVVLFYLFNNYANAEERNHNHRRNRICNCNLNTINNNNSGNCSCNCNRIRSSNNNNNIGS